MVTPPPVVVPPSVSWWTVPQTREDFSAQWRIEVPRILLADRSKVVYKEPTE